MSDRTKLQSAADYVVFIGHSPDEETATDVAERSLRAETWKHHTLELHRISRQSLGTAYTRPTEQRDGGLWDAISEAPMSTEHAIARFFIPYLCNYRGWALFTDGDVLFRRSVSELFAHADDRYAVMCVQHPELPAIGVKKTGDIQLPYRRKNWSSVMLFNCGHPANLTLTKDLVNERPGRWLHAFSWLESDLIGALPTEWNYLVGVAREPVDDPALVHFTLGTPDVRTYNATYVDPALVREWQAYAQLPVRA